MEAISHYIHLFYWGYFFLSFSMFGLFIMSLVNRNKNSLGILTFISSLALAITMYFFTFFYGVLLDEFNLENDLIITSLGLLSATFFVIQSLLFLFRLMKKTK